MRYIMKFLLRLLGWKVVGESPKDDKVIIVFAPHTSNWDFVLMLMVRFCYKMKAAFLGKHTLFRAPYGWFFKMFGGIPVKRSSSHNVVDQISQTIQKRKKIALALAPEGTRSKTNAWKSGFYHIALKAKVPLILAYLDKRTKQLGLGMKYELTGNVDKDMQVIKNFYQDKVGIKPSLTSEIRLEIKD